MKVTMKRLLCGLPNILVILFIAACDKGTPNGPSDTSYFPQVTGSISCEEFDRFP